MEKTAQASLRMVSDSGTWNANAHRRIAGDHTRARRLSDGNSHAIEIILRPCVQTPATGGNGFADSSGRLGCPATRKSLRQSCSRTSGHEVAVPWVPEVAASWVSKVAASCVPEVAVPWVSKVAASCVSGVAVPWVSEVSASCVQRCRRRVFQIRDDMVIHIPRGMLRSAHRPCAWRP
jgi:hypothetical protein